MQGVAGGKEGMMCQMGEGEGGLHYWSRVRQGTECTSGGCQHDAPGRKGVQGAEQESLCCAGGRAGLSQAWCPTQVTWGCLRLVLCRWPLLAIPSPPCPPAQASPAPGTPMPRGQMSGIAPPPPVRGHHTSLATLQTAPVSPLPGHHTSPATLHPAPVCPATLSPPF